VARDRKRAKQRRGRGGAAAAGRRDAAAASGSNGAPDPLAELPSEANVPAALEHAGDAAEFDAALIRGAGGVPADVDAGDAVLADGDHLSEGEVEAEALSEGDIGEDELQEPAGSPVRRRPGGGGADGGVSAEQASGAPIAKGNRAIGFLRASWAELQRVQWPDRRQVTQATAVVLGFVAVAGAYLGLADYVAKEIVEFIL
jgi:preprotein translocase subunit SecE